MESLGVRPTVPPKSFDPDPGPYVSRDMASRNAERRPIGRREVAID
jgi:hypothetical protein